METIILILALIFEIAFAAYCIMTRSRQSKVRSYIRIGAFIAFLLFTLLSIIQWGYTWYLFAALLFIWALLGVWSLVRTKPEKKEYKPWRSVVSAIGAFLLILLVMIPALIFPQHNSPRVTGKHAVTTVNYTYTDESRIETFSKTGGPRKVNVEFWFPKESGKYPLIVFSHGSFGVKTSNTSTFIELASNGYVVCSIDHPYHSLFTVGTDGHFVTFDQSYYQQVVDANAGKYDAADSFKLEKGWMALRMADIKFVLDTVLAQTKKADSGAVYQLVDADKIGLMGHSLGGESSAQVARERNDIDAVINLDADLGGEYLDYANGKYVMNDQPYPVPLLTILGDDLLRLLAKIPDANNVVALKRVNASAPTAFEVDVTGTDHLSFTDLPLVSPFLANLITSAVPKSGGGAPADKLAVIEKVNALTLQFFNAYVKGEGTFSAGGK